MPHFRDPQDLARYVEGLREKEAFSQLFDRLEMEKRYSRMPIAVSAQRELRRNARRIQREILRRMLIAGILRLVR